MWRTCDTYGGWGDKGFWWTNFKEKDTLEKLGVRGRMMIKWVFKLLDGGRGLDGSGSGREPVATCCEYGNAPSGFVRFLEYFDFFFYLLARKSP